MGSQLAAPPQIEEVVQAFEQSTSAFTTHEVRVRLSQARANVTDPTAAGAWADVLAFTLEPATDAYRPWGTYFGPIGSFVRADGTTVYSPDVSDADPLILEHWIVRARTLTVPVLRARYADLAWDMSRKIGKRRPDPSMARLAIASYLKCLETDRLSDIHDRFDAAERALELAISLNDEALVDASRAALMSIHESVVSQRKPLWWRTIDRLLNDKSARTTDVEQARLVQQLEDIAVFHSNVSDPKAFDPHATESAAERLIQFYNRARRGDDVRRIQALLARSFEHFASLGNAMIASSALQTAFNAYRAAGLKEDARRVRVGIEDAIERSRDEMATFSMERSITKEDMDRFLESVVVADLGQTFANIAVQFVPSKEELQKRIAELAEHAPLMALLSQALVTGNRVAAVVGSVEDDPTGRIIVQANQDMDLSDIWLREALIRTAEVHNLSADHIVAWVARSGLFEDTSLLREGVRAWIEGDYTKAIHVLVPQVEHGLRSIADKLGRPVTKPHPAVKGASVAINMGDILGSDVAEALGPDLTLYFLALYADPRGFNLRNELAHGLVAPEIMHVDTAGRIIHTLLIYGVWDELAKARSGAGLRQSARMQP